MASVARPGAQSRRAMRCPADQPCIDSSSITPGEPASKAPKFGAQRRAAPSTQKRGEYAGSVYAKRRMALSVTCPSCGKSFQLAQEIYDRKVAGKIVSIRCKQCQAGIRIDATQPGGLRVLGATPSTNESAQGVRARQPTLIGMMGPGGAVTSGASAEGALWAVDSGGSGEDRELDDATIAREIAAGM